MFDQAELATIHKVLTWFMFEPCDRVTANAMHIVLTGLLGYSTYVRFEPNNVIKVYELFLHKQIYLSINGYTGTITQVYVRKVTSSPMSHP